MFSKAWYR